MPVPRATLRLASLAGHLVAGESADADDVVTDEQQLRALVRHMCRAIGSDESEQNIVADHLVEAMLKGHDSHGVQMLSGYIANQLGGRLHPNSQVEVVGVSSHALVSSHANPIKHHPALD